MFAVVPAWYWIGMCVSLVACIFYAKKMRYVRLGDLLHYFLVVIFWPSLLPAILCLDRGPVIWRKK